MIQTALLFSDVQPDIAVYYLGWNDARVQHVKALCLNRTTESRILWTTVIFPVRETIC